MKLYNQTVLVTLYPNCLRDRRTTNVGVFFKGGVKFLCSFFIYFIIVVMAMRMGMINHTSNIIYWWWMGDSTVLGENH